MRIHAWPLTALALLAPAALLLSAAEPPAGPDHTLKLSLRTRVETFKGSGVWDEVVVTHAPARRRDGRHYMRYVGQSLVP